ncbi:hypothetical protein BDV95DRAFT_580631 [Massariosphaeria phaeospora]|uniref:Uncharacterized protein n=1 Tax=Massariosphaeria phaeospora TaxID=100035 RepID=A0A7C8I3D3_9PLEO|nr:hypothetical protein BDV95DRAFT_580631 [Massariosphaeria phaeospora]
MSDPDSARFLRGDVVVIHQTVVDPAEDNVDDVDAWWTTVDLPWQLELPGYMRARRYSSKPRSEYNDSRTYMALYEVTTLEAALAPRKTPIPGTQDHLPSVTRMEHWALSVLCSQPWTADVYKPQLGNCMAMLVFDYSSLNSKYTEEELLEHITKSEAVQVVSSHVVLSFRLLRNPRATTEADDRIDYENVQEPQKLHEPQYVTLVEFAVPDGLESPIIMHTVQELTNRIGLLGGVLFAFQTFRLICSMDADICPGTGEAVVASIETA